MIRTTDQLIDKIAEELVWRRKELTELRAMVNETNGKIRSRVVIRSAIALLYAHWEGFVKKVSSYYLEYVASHRLPYRLLAGNFVALSLKSQFSELAASEKISGANKLAEFFCNSLDRQSSIPYKNTVNTKSNLSSKVLLDIISALGLDEREFTTRLVFIDTNLVNPRNYVAHGEALNMPIEEYLALHDGVIDLINIYRNEIENASVMKRFERK